MEADENRELLERLLATSDAPCPSCEYNLRGLKGQHCPECNQRLVLRVGLAEPRLGAFVTGLVGIAAGLGFCGLLGIYFLVYLIHRNFQFAGPGAAIVPLPIGTTLCGGLLWWWIDRRGWLGRKERGPRWAITAAVFAVSLVCPLAFTVLIR
ncbi:MAG: hypothetical protein IT438_04465 [Phycisphaerales bacterium]|nr:hypothetical protein [Phycisphaerales bacterium]